MSNVTVEQLEAMADEININIEIVNQKEQELKLKEKALKLREETVNAQSIELQKKSAELIKFESKLQQIHESMIERDKALNKCLSRFLTERSTFELSV